MPTLPNLAVPADMTDYGYEPVSEEILARASTRVRRFLGQDVTAGTSETLLRGVGPWLLPQRPVVGVVSAVDANDDAVDVELSGQWVRSPVCGPLTVTYEHGFDPVPDAVVEVVCSIAARLAAIPPAMAAGVRTEQAGGESVTWGADGWQGTTGLTRPEREALRRIYPVRPRTAILI